jgi:hypothetical protein
MPKISGSMRPSFLKCSSLEHDCLRSKARQKPNFAGKLCINSAKDERPAQQ